MVTELIQIRSVRNNLKASVGLDDETTLQMAFNTWVILE